MNFFGNKSDPEITEKQAVDVRLKKIESKLSILMVVGIVQSALLAIIAVGYFMPTTFTLIMMLGLLIGFVFVFHKQIPRWTGNLTRWFFSQLLSAQ